jgi:hypothetical protein
LSEQSSNSVSYAALYLLIDYSDYVPGGDFCYGGSG